jgi:coenzyme Q-binding protein COQ10
VTAGIFPTMLQLKRATKVVPQQQSRSFLLNLLNKAQQKDASSQHWQRVVPHPISTIYRAVAEVDAYDQFLPWCMKSEVLKRSVAADGSGELQTEIMVGFRHMSAAFNSRVNLVPLQRVHAVSEANEFIEHLSFTWEFGAIGERACRLDLTLDFGLRNPEHILMWELAQSKVISEYVRCFSKRCVQLEAEESATQRASDGAPPDDSTGGRGGASA